ncbi:hypothetical protein PVAP13_5NG407340 [Panicum virgatum]|uniref:Uncharacterized protein n=1 Tax=Panicum virgatum TaxID=38727 RepID=A0A8T0S123_PANVG|nr:hypothetical protein PVAP13_5NG407340 [Panicum virgatum]
MASGSFSGLFWLLPASNPARRNGWKGTEKLHFYFRFYIFLRKQDPVRCRGGPLRAWPAPLRKVEITCLA